MTWSAIKSLYIENPHKVIQCPCLCYTGHGPLHGSRLAPYVMSSRAGQAWHKAQVGSQWRMCSLRGEEVLKPEGLSLALSPWARYHLLPFPSPAGLSFIPRPGCPNRLDDWAFPVLQTHHATLQHGLWRIHCLSEGDGMVLLAEIIARIVKKGFKQSWIVLDLNNLGKALWNPSEVLNIAQYWV